MAGRRWVIGACAMLAGCNLLSGAADLVTGSGDGGPVDVVPDGSIAPDGGTGGKDGSIDARDGAVGPIPDASVDAMDGGPSRPDGGRFVFVTSTQTTGDLMGVAGADTSCTSLAASAGLGGAWMAWVSTMASSAPSRLTSAGPWYLVTGALVAASKAELTAFGVIEHAIDRDERGTMRINSPVWTGGSFGFLNCSDWTSAAAGMSGTTGTTQFATMEWQQMGTATCDLTHRLYCFEN